MKLGFGLYRHEVTADNLRFAQQCGATHRVIHLVDYFRKPDSVRKDQPVGDLAGWGVTGDKTLWDYDELMQIETLVEENGLVWEAVENFNPAHWHDILLDGPLKEQQMEGLQETIRTLGRVGIRTMGCNLPHYCETFIDEGDIDVERVFRILHANEYDGLVIPDHAPQMACSAPWHAGMACAMGYLAAMRTSTAPT